MEEIGLVLPKINNEGQYVVQIKEEYVETGGHFQSQSFMLDVPQENGIYNLDINFKIDIGILNGYAHIDDTMNFDEIECLVGEDTVIGSITNTVNINDNIIKVSDSVLEYCSVGFYITLFDGINSVNMGMVLKKDLENKTIELENKSTLSLEVGSLVRMTVKLIPVMHLKGNTKIEFGYKKTGTNYLQSERILRVKYNNKNNTAKKFIFILEYLY